jgi:putative PEP-CTERM system response regulator
MMNNKPLILIVDDEESLRHSMRMALEGKYAVETAKDGKTALDIVKEKPVDVALLDIRLPEVDGIEVLKQIREIDETIPVIMITAVITVNTAVEAMKIGAYDYITKPFNIDELQILITKALEKRELLKENIYLRTEVLESEKFEEIVSKSKPMLEVFKTIDDVAASNATVLIQGESGTGKELVAKAIHKRSKRAKKLFVPVNCAAIPENLIESELFGHEKGSFTGAFERHLGKFEIAGGGTLFLDEIGTLPLGMQAKLLRCLQERTIERIGGRKPIPVDVRIISATNANLQKAVGEKKFREDLFYRINVIPINIPSLRKRPEDIPLLIKHFLDKYNQEFGRKVKGFTKQSLKAFGSYAWPGNVRELENLMERLVVLGKDGHIDIDRLPPEISGNVKSMPHMDTPEELNLKRAERKFEAEFIRQALEKAGGSKGKAAKLLGIHRNTLIKLERKIKEAPHDIN